eukprot:6173926-Pleurochrysis_carterae.AAC.2
MNGPWVNVSRTDRPGTQTHACRLVTSCVPATECACSFICACDRTSEGARKGTHARGRTRGVQNSPR